MIGIMAFGCIFSIVCCVHNYEIELDTYIIEENSISGLRGPLGASLHLIIDFGVGCD